MNNDKDVLKEVLKNLRSVISNDPAINLLIDESIKLIVMSLKE